MKKDGYFLLGAGSIIILGMLGALLLVPRANPIFIYYQIISLIFISFFVYKVNFEEDTICAYKSRFVNLPVNMFLYAFPLLALNLIAAIFLEGVQLGSIIITFIASSTSAIIAYIIIAPYSINEIHFDKPKKSNLLNISAILILGFGLRAYVMGWQEIPIGNDAPVYLLQALKGLEMPLTDLIKSGLSISSDPYQDTWQFSQLWLTLSLMFLKILGLGPLYISKAVIPFLSALSILGVYFLGKAIFDERFGTNAALIFAILPTEVLFAQLYKEVLGELFLILSLVFFLRAVTRWEESKRFRTGDVILFLICMIVLAKSAVTSITFLVFFLIALGLLALLKLNRISLKTAVLLIFLGSAGAILLFHWLPASDSILSRMHGLSYLRVPEGWRIHPYGYFTLPIMALTNIVPATLAIFYIYKLARREKLEALEVRALAFSLPLLFVITLVSQFLTTIMGYNLFPTSLFYYSIRLSIYSGIPIAIVTAAFMTRAKKYNRVVPILIILILVINFYICVNPGTTIHTSMLSTPIDEESYRLLESISGPSTVFVAGNFSKDQYGLNGTGLGYKNWIEYIVYKNTGKDPVFIGPLSNISNQTGKVIKYENESLTEVR